MSTIRNPVELRRRGVEILVRELGYADAMRFLLQYELGAGDYTQERKNLMPEWNVDEMINEADKQTKSCP
jgi:hypothetical protein